MQIACLMLVIVNYDLIKRSFSRALVTERTSSLCGVCSRRECVIISSFALPRLASPPPSLRRRARRQICSSVS
jgi:hypothetical protein